jgi:uncharacterized protein
MDHRDRQAIDELFTRLAQVEGQAPPRDEEAEALIRRRIAASPGAPYHMAQTIVAQDAALREAERRLAALEADLAEARAQGGGFLSGLFGDDRPRRAMSGTSRAPAGSAQGGGGGFLAGAAQTAVGVTGGILLAQAVTGALSGPAAAGDLHAAGGKGETGGDDGADFEDGGGWDDFDI